MNFIQLISLCSFDFVFVISIWASGLAETHNFHHTLSYMLDNVLSTKVLYSVWLCGYIISSGVIMYAVKNNKLQNKYSDLITDFGASKMIDVLNYMYIFNVVTKLIGMIFVPVFNSEKQYKIHYTFSTIAFASGILMCWYLFAKRLVVYYFHKRASHNSIYDLSDIEAKYYHCILPKVLVLNFIWLILGITILSIFIRAQSGPPEFFLCIWIILDPLFQINDIYSSKLLER